MSLLSQFFKTEKPHMSTFNLSRRLLTTSAPFTVMPVLVEECLPGDRFKYNLVCGIKTLQTLAPVYGGIDVDFSFYFSALSNYVPAMGQNGYGFEENNLALPWFAPCIGAKELFVTNEVRTANRGDITNVVPYFYTTEAKDGNYHHHFYLPESSNSESIPHEARVATIAPTSLWDALGYGSGFCFFADQPESDGSFVSDQIGDPLSSLPFLVYWDIIRNYIANPQFDSIPVYGIGRPNTSYRSPWLNTSVSLSHLDSFFANSYKFQSTSPTAYERFDPHLDTFSIWNYSLLYGEYSFGLNQYDTSKVYYTSAEAMYNPMSGLALSTYGSDYLTTVLNSKKVKNVVSRNAVQVQNINGSNVFTIDTLRFANKRARLTNLSLFSGTRFDDWQRATWSVKPNARLGIPFFIGSCKSTIAFDEILSNSNAVATGSNASSGLGQAAGRIDDGFSSANHYFECDTYGLFMVIMTIKPKLFYSRREPLTRRTDLSDIYHDIYDRVGYQDVMVNEYDSAAGFHFHSFTNKDVYGSFSRTDNVAVGSVPAYAEYMTSVDKVSGALSPNGGSLANWTTSFYGMYYFDSKGVPHRRLSDFTFSSFIPIDGVSSGFRFDSYGDPFTVNNLFSDTSDVAQNFIVSIRHNLFVNRNKQKNILPTL